MDDICVLSRLWSAKGIQKHHGILLEVKGNALLFAPTTTFRHASSLEGQVRQESKKHFCPINKDPRDEGVVYSTIRMVAGETDLLKWVYMRSASKINLDDPKVENIFVEGPSGEKYSLDTVEFIKQCILKNGPLDPDERKEDQEHPSEERGEALTTPASEQPVA